MSDELQEFTPSKKEVLLYVESTTCDSMGCPLCFRPHRKVTFDAIKRDDDGWKASGRAYCPQCGFTAEAIRTETPIFAQNFECPSCHKVDALTYTVNNITRSNDDDGFGFEVDIKCSKCSKKRSFKKVLKSILDIIKIEIKPTGIEVKKG